jgi:peptidyl-prolyl cis-trans isomerase C
MLRRIGKAALCAAVLASWAGQSVARQPAAEKKVVATVNGAEITLAELEEAVRMGPPLPSGGDPALAAGARKQRYVEALGLLIDDVLINQFLAKRTQPASEAEVNRRLAELEAGLKQKGKTLADFCRDSRRTPDQLRSNIADYLRWSAYVAAQTPEPALVKYYEANRDVFDKVTVRASHIVLRVPPGATAAEKERLRAQLLDIRKALMNDPKADFAEYARKYSQDVQASKGGDLGWFPPKWVFEESFSRAAFALKIGQISDVVQTDYGLHLIKVTDRKAGEKSEYAKVKEAVREFCTEDLRQQVLAEQRRASSDQIKLFLGN